MGDRDERATRFAKARRMQADTLPAYLMKVGALLGTRKPDLGIAVRLSGKHSALFLKSEKVEKESAVQSHPAAAGYIWWNSNSFVIG
jgi:hypothetical protein